MRQAGRQLGRLCGTGALHSAASTSAAAAAARVPRINFPQRLAPNGTRLSAQPRSEPLLAQQVAPAPAPAPAVPAPAAPAQPRLAAAPLRERMGVPHTDEAATSIRKIIASRLLESKREAPHLYVSREAVLDKLLLLRERLATQGQKASVNDFVVRAAALALARVPEAAALAPLGAAIDVAVAVALPNGGLTTPTVRGADKLTLAEVSGEIKRLAARAREGRLKLEEYSGGAITLSNLGMFPVSNFAAILNPPQAAILAVGRAESRVVLDGGEPRSVTVCAATLTVDQSRVQGASAAAYLDAFCAAIASPETLL